MSLCSTAYLFSQNLKILYADNLKKEAIFYKQLKDNKIQCLHCPHGCTVSIGERGFCRIKENNNGKFYNIVHENPCAIHIDPIEKKPFFHYMPATKSLSIATVGCNLRCKFCQNWQISQANPEDVNSINLSVEDIVNNAQKAKTPTIAYTYTEPLIFYEYALDIAVLARERGIKNIMHSNGFINNAPLKRFCKYLDAINIDLKGFTEEYYTNICSGNLNRVLDNLVFIKNETDIWIELTTLIVPSLNDNSEVLKRMCNWIVNNLGEDVPLHFSRFFPIYKLSSLPPTPISTLEKARKIANNSGLKYVYIGNLPGNEAENTFCHKCKKVLIQRSGYTIVRNILKKNCCPFCKELIPGYFL